MVVTLFKYGAVLILGATVSAAVTASIARRDREIDKRKFEAAERYYEESMIRLEAVCTDTEDLRYGRMAAIGFLEPFYRVDDGQNQQRAAEIQSYIDKGILQEIAFNSDFPNPIIASGWCELNDYEQTKIAETILRYYMSQHGASSSVKFELGGSYMFGVYRPGGWFKRTDYEYDPCRLVAEQGR